MAESDIHPGTIGISEQKELALRVIAVLNSAASNGGMIRGIVEAIREITGLEALGVRLQQGVDYPYVATSGFPPRFVELESRLCRYDRFGEPLLDDDGEPLLECMCGSVIRGGVDPTKPFFSRGGSFWTGSSSELLASVSAADLGTTTRNRCNREGYESVALIPLRNARGVFGLLQLNDRRRGLHTPELVEFFEELGASIGVALEQTRSADALRLSEIRLRTMIDSLPFDVFALDRSQRYVMQNAVSRKRCGDALGKRPADVAPDADTLVRWESNNRRVLAGQSVDEDVTFVTGGGATYVRNIITPIRDGDETIGIIGVNLDVTDRVRAEASLAKSEHRYRVVVESQDDLVVSTDTDGRLLFVSPSYCKAFGKSEFDLLGRRFRPPVHEDDRDRFSLALSRLFEPPHASTHEERILTENGWRWFSWSNKGILDRNDNLESIISVGRDITDQMQTLDRLREREATLQTIFRAVPIGIGLVKERIIGWTNEPFQRMVGYTADELDGQSARMLYPSDEEFERVARVKHPQVLERGTGSVETRFMRKDGSEFDVLLSSSAIVSGELAAGLIFTVVDLTEIKQAQKLISVQRDLAQALAATTSLEEALAKCLETAIDAASLDCGGVYLVDEATGDLRLAHARGLTEAFVESATHYDATSPNSRLIMAGEPVYRLHQEMGIPTDDARKQEELRALAVLPVRHQGRIIACLNVASHTRDDIPATDRVVIESIAAQLGSIIARLKTEQSRRQYADNLARLARTAMGFMSLLPEADLYDHIAEQAAAITNGSMVFVADYDEERELFTVRAERNLGPNLTALQQILGLEVAGMEVRMTREVVQSLIGGGLVRMTNSVHEMTGGQVSQIAEAAVEEILGVREIYAMGFTRGQRLLGAVGFMLREGDAAIDSALVEAFVGQASSALERQRAFRDKESLEEQLIHAQKMEAIGTLASGVAHDFNNLLTAVLGHAYMLKGRHEPGTEVFTSAETIETAALRASDLTKQLLGFARKGRRQNVVVDLHQLVDDVIFFLEHTIDKRIDLVKSTLPDPLLVRGDASQLQAVILNLAVNARDAMLEGGEIRFTTEYVRVEDERGGTGPLKPGRYICLSVTDTGSGIPDEIKDRIYEPFFSTKEASKGTGMGLAMVYGVVRDHGGWIDLVSQIGRGSTFKVYLPRAESVPARATDAAAAKKPLPGEGKILVVDDQDSVRGAMNRMLRHLGYEAVGVASGQAAIDYYREHGAEIDLVFLDQIMPVMNGSTCYRALREIDPEVRVIMVSGNTDDKSMQELLKEGAIAYLEKPLLLEPLSRAVAAALGHAPAGSTGRSRSG